LSARGDGATLGGAGRLSAFSGPRFANDPTEPRENLLMAASLLMAAPCLVIFFTMQRYFVRGIIMSGIKG